MKTYSGRLWLTPDKDSKLRVEIRLRDERIRITSNEDVIGDWPLAGVGVRSTGSTEVRLAVEGEELVIFTRDADFVPTMLAYKSKVDQDSNAIGRAVVSVRNRGLIDSGDEVSFDRNKPIRSAPAESSERAS